MSIASGNTKLQDIKTASVWVLAGRLHLIQIPDAVLVSFETCHEVARSNLNKIDICPPQFYIATVHDNSMLHRLPGKI